MNSFSPNLCTEIIRYNYYVTSIRIAAYAATNKIYQDHKIYKSTSQILVIMPLTQSRATSGWRGVGSLPSNGPRCRTQNCTRVHTCHPASAVVTFSLRNILILSGSDLPCERATMHSLTQAPAPTCSRAQCLNVLLLFIGTLSQ
jgi:hypothetical protein